MEPTVQAFAQALKAARRERDLYRREHAQLLAYIQREGQKQEGYLHNTRLMGRLRQVMLQATAALRPEHEDLARQIVEIMGLSVPAPVKRRPRGRA